MRNKIGLVLQILGIVMFITGTLTSKNGNVLPFLIGCFIGLPPPQQ